MFGSDLVRKQDAKLHYSVMTYLIRQFGTPPLATMPSQIDASSRSYMTSFHQRNPHLLSYKSEDRFEKLKWACHMGTYDIEFVPTPDDISVNNTAASRRLEVLAAGRIPYGKSNGGPIFYDPRACENPDYFTAAITLKLAALRLDKFEPREQLTKLQHVLITLCAASYNRQGFVLANLVKPVSAYLAKTHKSRAIPDRLILNTLCFTTCLSLRIRHYSIEQIIGTYGHCMGKSIRRKFRQASLQIDMNTEILGILQILAEQHSLPHTLTYNA